MGYAYEFITNVVRKSIFGCLCLSKDSNRSVDVFTPNLDRMQLSSYGRFGLGGNAGSIG